MPLMVGLNKLKSCSIAGFEPIPERKPAKDRGLGLLAEAEDGRPSDDDQLEGPAQKARLGGRPEPRQPRQSEAAGLVPSDFLH